MPEGKVMSEIHLNDVGTSFEITLQDDETIVDVSNASVMEIIFKKPSGTVSVKPATHLTDGTDGVIRYISEVDFLNELDEWEIQARVTLPTGNWSTDIQNFVVYENLEALAP